MSESPDAKKGLTKASLLALRSYPPTKGNRIEWDDAVTGLGARVTAAGSMSFVLRYVVDGRERRMTLGRYPNELPTLTAAREAATKLKHRIGASRDDVAPFDPLNAREARRSAPDVRRLCGEYLDEHAPRKRASSVDDDRSMIQNHILPAFGRSRVAAVTHREIEALHRSLADRPYRANRVLALLSKMFSLAVKWRYRPDNPVRGIERFPEEKRTRWLNVDEIRRLATALDEYPKRGANGATEEAGRRRAADAIRLLLLTGARRGEVLGMRWDQIDFERAVWTKPASSTKQKRDHHIPLSQQALVVLREIQNRGLPGPYIFPGNVADKPLQEIKKAWKAICDLARLSGANDAPDCRIRLHDLRHTYAAHLVSNGMSLSLVGGLLGHSQISTTQRYAHLADDPLREGTAWIGALFEAAQKQKPPAEILPLPRRPARG